MMADEVNYIFYPTSSLSCFSNDEAFRNVVKNKKEIKRLAATRVIARKKTKRGG